MLSDPVCIALVAHCLLQIEMGLSSLTYAGTWPRYVLGMGINPQHTCVKTTVFSLFLLHVYTFCVWV